MRAKQLSQERPPKSVGGAEPFPPPRWAGASIFSPARNERSACARGCVKNPLRLGGGGGLPNLLSDSRETSPLWYVSPRCRQFSGVSPIHRSHPAQKDQGLRRSRAEERVRVARECLSLALRRWPSSKECERRASRTSRLPSSRTRWPRSRSSSRPTPSIASALGWRSQRGPNSRSQARRGLPQAAAAGEVHQVIEEVKMK